MRNPFGEEKRRRRCDAWCFDVSPRHVSTRDTTHRQKRGQGTAVEPSACTDTPHADPPPCLQPRSVMSRAPTIPRAPSQQAAPLPRAALIIHAPGGVLAACYLRRLCPQVRQRRPPTRQYPPRSGSVVAASWLPPTSVQRRPNCVVPCEASVLRGSMAKLFCLVPSRAFKLNDMSGVFRDSRRSTIRAA